MQLHRVITDARALAWHFCNNDVAMSALLGLQVGPESVPLGVVTDIRAKWWTIYEMIVRLRELRSYISLLEAHGTLHCNLTESGWDILKTVEILLEPLTIVQRALACQKHVTISLMPYTIAQVRNGFKKILAENQLPVSTREIAANMLEDPIKGLYAFWGKGDDGAIFEEVNARKRRQVDGSTGKGFSQSVLLAAALDPRTKVLAGIGKQDKEKIWSLLTQKMRMVRRESCVGLVSTGAGAGTGAAAALRSTSEYPESMDIFCEIGVDSEDKGEGDGGREGQYYRLDEESKGIADNEISRELDLYIKTPLLGMKIQTEYSNPLAWWKIHKDTFPVLSVLARKYLCIPVTSAPCKRVFTVAGLEETERRLLVTPKDIPRLIFLNDSKDAAVKYDIKYSDNINSV
jgi:hAT family C-terminal dimerisation region